MGIPKLQSAQTKPSQHPKSYFNGISTDFNGQDINKSSHTIPGNNGISYNNIKFNRISSNHSNITDSQFESEMENLMVQETVSTPLVTVPNNTPTPIDIKNNNNMSNKPNFVKNHTTHYMKENKNSRKNTFLLPPLKMNFETVLNNEDNSSTTTTTTTTNNNNNKNTGSNTDNDLESLYHSKPDISIHKTDKITTSLPHFNNLFDLNMKKKLNKRKETLSTLTTHNKRIMIMRDTDTDTETDPCLLSPILNTTIPKRYNKNNDQRKKDLITHVGTAIQVSDNNKSNNSTNNTPISIPLSSQQSSSTSTHWSSSVQYPFTNQNFQNFDGGKNRFDKSNNNNNNKIIEINSNSKNHSTHPSQNTTTIAINLSSSSESSPESLSSSSTPLYRINDSLNNSLNPQQLHINIIQPPMPPSLINTSDTPDDDMSLIKSNKAPIDTAIENADEYSTDIKDKTTATSTTTTITYSTTNSTTDSTSTIPNNIDDKDNKDTEQEKTFAWNMSKIPNFKTNIFPKPLNTLGTDYLMKGDVLNPISAIASNVSNTRGLNDTSMDNHEITQPENISEIATEMNDTNEIFANLDNRRISRDEHGLDIISSASLVASSLPSSSSSTETKFNNNTDTLKDNMLPLVTKKEVNSRFTELRHRLLKNPRTVPILGSKNTSVPNKPEHALLDTAAVVLSTLRSSPFRVSDRRSSSFSIPFSSNPGTNPPSSSSNNNHNNNHLNTSNFLNGNSNLFVSSIKSRPHSSSFSSALKPHTRPILRIHQKEDPVGNKLVNHSAISSDSNSSGDETEEEKERSISQAGDTISKSEERRSSMDIIPPRDRNVTWNKNGRRILKTSLPDGSADKSGPPNESKINQDKDHKKPPAQRRKGRSVKAGRGRKSNVKENNTNQESAPNATDKELPPRKPKKEKQTSGATRSRSGCWICRLRKKKCTEEKPKCFNCDRLNLECCYSLLRPDFVTDETLRKAKLQEIKLNTREAKRLAMKKRSFMGNDAAWSDDIAPKTRKIEPKDETEITGEDKKSATTDEDQKPATTEEDKKIVTTEEDNKPVNTEEDNIPVTTEVEPNKIEEKSTPAVISTPPIIKEEKKQISPGIRNDSMKTVFVRNKLQDKLPSPTVIETNPRFRRKGFVIKPVEVILNTVSNKKTVNPDDRKTR